MGLIIQSPDARNDLIEIWLYIAQENQAAANRLIASIEEKLNLLSDSPQMGQTREDLAPLIRSFPVSKYLLFYRPISDGIQLVRVIHGARDIQNLFE
jgi:toxin ParE1/3/4